MKKPFKYNSEEVATLAKISTRSDAKGNVFYYVEYYFNDQVGLCGFKCDSLFTAIDIIKNNFYDPRSKK